MISIYIYEAKNLPVMVMRRKATATVVMGLAGKAILGKMILWTLFSTSYLLIRPGGLLLVKLCFSSWYNRPMPLQLFQTIAGYCKGYMSLKFSGTWEASQTSRRMIWDPQPQLWVGAFKFSKRDECSAHFARALRLHHTHAHLVSAFVITAPSGSLGLIRVRCLFVYQKTSNVMTSQLGSIVLIRLTSKVWHHVIIWRSLDTNKCHNIMGMEASYDNNVTWLLYSHGQ